MTKPVVASILGVDVNFSLEKMQLLSSVSSSLSSIICPLATFPRHVLASLNTSI